MAFVIEQDTIFATYVFEDEDLEQTTRSFQIRWDTDVATTLGNAATLGNHLAAVTRCKVVSFKAAVEYVDAAAALTAGAELSENGAVVFSLVQNPPMGISKSATVNIPDPIAAVRVAASGPQSNVINTSATEIVALFNDFQAAGIAYLSHGQDADQVLDGYIHHKKSSSKK